MKIKIKTMLAACALSLSAFATWADDMSGQFIQAVIRDHASAIMSLLLKGVDPNVRDERDAPALYLALQLESLNAAQAILASPRLDPNLPTPTDETPLMMAAFKGQMEIARALLDKGAKVNRTGWSPLHYAATGGRIELIRLLLDHGADIEARSPNGSTPLMMASRYGSAEAVQMLLRAGADSRAHNVLGMDALDFSVSNERFDIAEIITEARRRTPMRAAAQPESEAATPASPAASDGAGASAVVVTPVASPAATPEEPPPAAAAPAPRSPEADNTGLSQALSGQAVQITPPAETPAAATPDSPARPIAPAPPSDKPPVLLPSANGW
jgi:hypothetical protein